MNQALDFVRAAWRQAGLALAVIDGECVLKITELAIGLGIVAQRRSACGYGFGQYVFYDRHKFRASFAGNGRGVALWRDPRAVESFADIDIAETGNHCLVEQGGFDRRLLAYE